jgi:hypothetical protein
MTARPPEDIARAAIDHAIASEHRRILMLAVPYARLANVDRLRQIFDRFENDDELRGGVLEALRHLYERPPADLHELLAVGGKKTRSAVAGYLGCDGKYRDERLLVMMLGDIDEDVQVRAAESLERIGTTDAVEPLREWSKGLLRSVRVKEAAASSIRAIQSRSAGAARGQLSIASVSDHRGEVSLPKSTGEVSVSEES